MQLARLDPTSLFRDFDRVFETGFRPFRPAGMTADRWLPRVDVFDRDDQLVIRAELPGIPADAIDITVEAGALVISGTRETDTTEDDGGYHRREIFRGEFRRSLLLPEGIDIDAISATSKDGILEIAIPRSPEVLPKKIKVELTS